MRAFFTCWREPEESLASMIEGWQSGLTSPIPNCLTGRPKWSYLLVPGWRKWPASASRDCRGPWRVTQEHLLRDMAAIAPEAIRASVSTTFSPTPSGRCAPSAISPVCVSIARRPRKCLFQAHADAARARQMAESRSRARAAAAPLLLVTRSGAEICRRSKTTFRRAGLRRIARRPSNIDSAAGGRHVAPSRAVRNARGAPP